MPRSSSASITQVALARARAQPPVSRCCDPTWNEIPVAMPAFGGRGEQLDRGVRVGAELPAERPVAAQAVGGQPAEGHRARRVGGELVELFQGVEGEHPTPAAWARGDVGRLLDGVAEAHPVGRRCPSDWHSSISPTLATSKLDPSSARTCEHLGVRVGLDRVEHLDPGQGADEVACTAAPPRRDRAPAAGSGFERIGDGEARASVSDGDDVVVGQ